MMPRVSRGRGCFTRVNLPVVNLQSVCNVTCQAADMDNQQRATELTAVLTDLAALLDRIDAEQAHGRTPCTEFNIAQLRHHVVGWLSAFADGFEDAGGQCSDPTQVTVTGTGAGDVRAAVDRLSASLPDAAARPLSIGGQAMPGDMALAMMLWEYQVHGWDLAQATGQPWSPSDAGLAASLEFAPGMLTDDFQGEGKAFAPRVAIDPHAPLIEQLVALSGRDPAWA